MPRRSQASSSRFMKRARPTSNSTRDRKSTRLNSSHSQISYAVFCLKKKLRQIAGADAFGNADGAIVECFQSAEKFQQRGFSRAVRAHQTDAVLRRDQPVHSLEQALMAITFSG